jgi:mannose-6-phosphate isomerase-like protein (cupin superfamily)
MTKPFIAHVNDFSPVQDEYNQTSRQLIQVPGFSIAHVAMPPGGALPFHEHRRTFQGYFMLSGQGVMTVRHWAEEAREGDLQFMHHTVGHRLRNTGSDDLAYLAIAMPSFDPMDVYLLPDQPEPQVEERNRGHAIDTKDLEFFYNFDNVYDSGQSVSKVGFAVAVVIPDAPGVRHYHNKSHEVYFVVKGEGNAHVGNRSEPIRSGSFVYVPPRMHHHFSAKEKSRLELLSICSPSRSPTPRLPCDPQDFVKV